MSSPGLELQETCLLEHVQNNFLRTDELKGYINFLS